MSLPLITELTAIGAAIAALVLIITQAKKAWAAWKTVWAWGKAVFIPNKQVEANKLAIEELKMSTEERFDVLETTMSGGFQSIETSLSALLDEVKGNGVGGSLKRALKLEVEARWRNYDLQGLAVWETGRLPNNEFGCIRASQPFKDLVGVLPVGIGWMTSLHEDDRDEVEERWEEAMKYGHEFSQFLRFVIRDSTGRAKQVNYALAQFKPEYTEEGEFIGGLGQLHPLEEEDFFDRKVGE